VGAGGCGPVAAAIGAAAAGAATGAGTGIGVGVGAGNEAGAGAGTGAGTAATGAAAGSRRARTASAGFDPSAAARGGSIGASISGMEGKGAGVETVADSVARTLLAFGLVPGAGSVPLASWIGSRSTFGVASAIAPGRGRLLRA